MQTPKRIALVTGANKGIGYEVAKQLGGDRCFVFLGSRDPALGDTAAKQLSAAGAEVQVIHLDMSNEDSIQQAAAEIEQKFGRLDILVNNAGIVDPKDGPPTTTDIAALDRIMQTNFYGAVAVTQAVLPLLRQSSAGVIVNVSSGLGSITKHGDPTWEFAAVKPLGYSASKAAMNMFTVQLAYELRETKIKVNSADPGYTATDLNGNSGPQTVEEGAAEVVRLALLDENGPTGGFFATAGPVPW